jgi:hypothetical protein
MRAAPRALIRATASIPDRRQRARSPGREGSVKSSKQPLALAREGGAGRSGASVGKFELRAPARAKRRHLSPRCRCRLHDRH